MLVTLGHCNTSAMNVSVLHLVFEPASSLNCNVAFGMEWTWHQFTPAMPVQKIVDRAVAGRMPDRLFIGGLEIVDVQHLARTGSLSKARQQSLFPGQRHVLALTAADRFRLQRL